MNWIFLSLGAALLWAIVNMLDAFILQKKIPGLRTYLAIDAPLLTVISCTILAFVGIQTTLPTIGILLLAGLLHGTMAVLYFKSIQEQEVSRVIPLFQLNSVILIVAGAFVFGEVFSWCIYAGAGLIILGAYILSAQGPLFRSIKLHKSFWLMMGAVVALSISQLLIKNAVGTVNTATIFAWDLLGISVIGWVFFIQKFSLVKKLFWKRIGYVGLVEIFDSTAILLLTIALITGPVGLVNTLGSTNIVFTLVLAIIASRWAPDFYEELIDRKNLSIKITAVTFVLIGGTIIAMLL